MNKEIQQLNKEIRTTKKLKCKIFYIEHMVWKSTLIETGKLSKEIERLEKRKRYLKKQEEIAEKKKVDPTYEPPTQYKNNIDIEKIKEIPIKDVLTERGIEIGRGNFFKIRNENTASANFDENKNLWIDRGPGTGGSVIDLVMVLDKKSVGEAIKELSRFL